MFRRTLTLPFFRGYAPSPTVTSPSLVRRIQQSASKSTLSFRFTSTRVATPNVTSRSAFIRDTLPSSRSSRSRPFSSSSKQNFHYEKNNKYRRFGNQDSLLIRLLHDVKPQHFVMIGLGISGFYIYNLETVEMTGRRRFNCVSAKQELKIGKQNYEEVLEEVRGHILPEDHPLTGLVNGVLQRLIPQAPLEGAEWKVHVIKDDHTPNAFVLPGGKVFVYTGILPICYDEDGLAAVLGHEIAHVVAHHPAERMSHSFLTMGAAFLVSLLFDVSGQISTMLLNLAFSLPNSRAQEAEADNIGLMMMSKACFNPEAAVAFWARMRHAEDGAPPQFLSTHPSSQNRMESIREWSYKAEAIFEDNGCHVLRSIVPSFEHAVQDYSWL